MKEEAKCVYGHSLDFRHFLEYLSHDHSLAHN